jgi:hypothetical protein
MASERGDHAGKQETVGKGAIKDRKGVLSSAELLQAWKVAGARLTPAGRLDIAESLLRATEQLEAAKKALQRATEKLLDEHTPGLDEVYPLLWPAGPARDALIRLCEEWGIEKGCPIAKHHWTCDCDGAGGDR